MELREGLSLLHLGTSRLSANLSLLAPVRQSRPILQMGTETEIQRSLGEESCRQEGIA